MALKYERSDDKKALKCLLSHLDLFIGMESTRRAPTFDENITISAINQVDTSSSSTILHSYGTHMVTSMSLGFLFLGRGNFTLLTSNKAIAGLIYALFPRYLIESYDSRAHLQAFRHLWVLGIEPRCLVLRDIETREACHIPVKKIIITP
ncbi:20445_t:CDS:2, partial [Cetraspora pellucida]